MADCSGAGYDEAIARFDARLRNHPTGGMPRRTEQLWSHCQHLFKLVTATALIIGGMASLVACDVSSDPKYAGDAYLEPDAAAGDAATDASAQDGDAAAVGDAAADGGAPVDAAEG